MRGCAAHSGPAFVECGSPFEPVGGILDGVVAAGFLAHDGHLVPRVRRHPGTQVQPDRRAVEVFVVNDVGVAELGEQREPIRDSCSPSAILLCLAMTTHVRERLGCRSVRLSACNSKIDCEINVATY